MDNENRIAVLDSFRAELKSNPGAEEAVVSLVNYYGAQEELDECEAILRKAIEARSGYARYHFMLGNLQLQKGLHSEAVKQLKIAMNAAPNNLQIKVALAETHGKHGNLDAALDVLQPLLEANPPHFPAVMVFANICTPLNMVEDCQILLEKLRITAQSRTAQPIAQC